VLAALHTECLLLLPLPDGTCEPHAAVIACVTVHAYQRPCRVVGSAGVVVVFLIDPPTERAGRRWVRALHIIVAGVVN
jgi:hypothetical protein